MGNLCQDCLKSQIKQPETNLSSQAALEMKKFSLDNQIISSSTLFSLQAQSIAELDTDYLIIFVDNPNAIFRNSFIKKLGISINNILGQKLAQAEKKGKSLNHEEAELCIKIDEPFYQIPVKKLVVVQLKVWDGKTNQNSYLKKVIGKGLNTCTKSSNKKSIAIIEIEPQLGYSLNSFQNILKQKLKEASNNGKLSHVIYVTDNRSNAQKLLQQDVPLTRHSQSGQEQSSNQSNYF